MVEMAGVEPASADLKRRLSFHERFRSQFPLRETPLLGKACTIGPTATFSRNPGG